MLSFFERPDFYVQQESLVASLTVKFTINSP